MERLPLQIAIGALSEGCGIATGEGTGERRDLSRVGSGSVGGRTLASSGARIGIVLEQRQ